MDETCDLEEGLAAWVCEAFVSACIRVWLARGSCYDKVYAIGKVWEDGWGEAVGIEWEAAALVKSGCGGEACGVS